MAQKSKWVLDAGALINSNFFGFTNAIIPSSVADEVKSRADVLQTLLESGIVEIKTPSAESRKRVETVARRMGEINALSKADIEVLALALEENAILITDDFHIQNVAGELGIPYEAVTEKIREKRRWKLRCINCGKTYPPTYKGKRCKICGGKLVYSSN